MRAVTFLLLTSVMALLSGVWAVGAIASLGAIEFSPKTYCKNTQQPVTTVLSGFCYWARKDPSDEHTCITERDVSGLSEVAVLEYEAEWYPIEQPKADGCLTIEAFNKLRDALLQAKK